MKKHYAWLWFDADGTLFDFNRAEMLALQHVFGLINTPFKPEYVALYKEYNQQLWHSLERQEITPAILQVRRFELLLSALQVEYSASQISAHYLQQLALCGDLIEGAYEMLREAHRKSRIAIVTNGLQMVQQGRMAHSAIHDFISELVISEEVGAAKPKTEFFEAASARSGNPAKDEILIIGDSLSADILGGANYGIDTCWFNPSGETQPDGMRITYQISKLSQLLDLIE
ncbi:MAG: noncanonical pyrimidine nucleotidase, YjjG family [Anaerolineae bacterium]|nr:noncanonical pyrimidine nucleotidase, YjjG family [Anaerolineae bacterium]